MCGMRGQKIVSVIGVCQNMECFLCFYKGLVIINESLQLDKQNMYCVILNIFTASERGKRLTSIHPSGTLNAQHQ
jgi:EamA domain-containing membrane protein RarD